MQFDILNMEDKEKVAIVCLYFARLKSSDPFYKEKKIEYYKVLEEKFEYKLTTIKNYQDTFDPEYDNGRNGWYKKTLRERGKFLYEVFQKYKEVRTDKLKEIVELIVNDEPHSKKISKKNEAMTKILKENSDEIIKKVEKNKIVKEYSTKVISNHIDKSVPRNRIIYGAPGTGKSYYLNKELKSIFPNENLYKRVTFYSQYSYSQFVGAYKPAPIYQETDKKLYEADMVTEISRNLEPLIDYKFVAGAFLEMLVKSLNDPQHNYLLLIEEINRANVSSVFGDIFQLLDRNELGESEYSIAFSSEAMNYLKSHGIYENAIKMPSNLYIWATMNSADQGVFPMDAAFKRRWNFEYFPLNKREDETSHYEINLKFLSKPIKWNVFRKIINDKLKGIGVSEDKLIGPFFLKKDELNSDNAFKNKLLLYLRDDILRHNYSQLFCKAIFSDIISDYEKGKKIFKINFEEVIEVDE